MSLALWIAVGCANDISIQMKEGFLSVVQQIIILIQGNIGKEKNTPVKQKIYVLIAIVK